MTELLFIAFAASEIAICAAAAHYRLRALPLVAAGAIGYITASILGAFILSVFVGDKAPLGPALGWIGVCFAAIIFLKSQPARREAATGTLSALWALGWRGVLSVVLACVCGVFADFIALLFAGFIVGVLGLSDEATMALFDSMTLYYFVVAVYLVACLALSFLFFLIGTRTRLAAVHAALFPKLIRES